ncbi:MAG: DEAD/DEAH box helicase [Burkholderiales bacterium]|nr:MAG: DEAD/DEAH box helicase [Burkholderiales bacterium]
MIEDAVSVRPEGTEQGDDSTGASFDDFGLHPDLVRAVEELGYVTPTPIQAKAIPVVMTGRDVMGAAQTGTGKTAGFALPILHRLMPLANTSPSPARHPTRALILAPTRELADQIYVNFVAYARHTQIRVACVFGGVDIKPQKEALRLGAEVLIATPGRLLDHVEQRTANLSMAQMLVLDEADRMLDMGFLPDIQRILALLPARRQNMMFSATFSDDIKRLASTILRMPQLIEVAQRNSAAENVTQKVFRVDSVDMKRAAVGHLVRSRELSQVIVFTNTKIGASRLARLLERDGLNAAPIHGDKTQQERLKTLDDFKAGRVSVLVATDVAARGLDISELPAVINYDLPYAPEDYVHRIGRTGRAGASGLALSLMAPGDERYLVEIEKLLQRKLPPQPLSGLETQRERAPRAARGEPGERASRAPRAARAGRGRAGAGGVADAARHGLSEDPFFFRPYEPSAGPEPDAEAADMLEAQAGDDAEAALASAQAPGIATRKAAKSAARRSARPVPALLGGLRKR